jgi:hypothetical protein
MESENDVNQNRQGGSMTIEYWSPFVRAFGRMKKALFQPFDLRKWFVVGFTAFLAGVMDWQGGGSGKSSHHAWQGWDDFFQFPEEIRTWLVHHPGWALVAAFGLVAVLVLAVLVTWLSSRGKFMFLDNVARDRDRVKAPWHDYKVQGDSLFLWRLALGVLGFAVIAGYVVLCFSSLYGMYADDLPGRALAMNAVGMCLGLFGLIVLAAYVSTFLNEFVVAIMYKHRSTTLPAIHAFWGLLKAQPLDFVFFGILFFFIQVCMVFLVVMVGVFTCCIGFLLLAIPYINAVVLLPISYTLRAFSLEFLAQYGAGLNAFSQSGGGKPRPGRAVPSKARSSAARSAARRKTAGGSASGRKSSSRKRPSKRT